MMGRDKLGLCDMHSHILPGMDDGCRSPAESVKILRICREQGVERICATPHYYPRETVQEFLRRRQASCRSLVQALQEAPCRVPAICLGAEVAYHPGLVYEERLEQLCLGNSGYLLLEMPFTRWSPAVLRDVRALQTARGIVPVIAHLERYYKLQDRGMIADLTASDVLIQMDAEYLLNPWTRGRAKRIIRDGMVTLLGSDCHNSTSRPPNLAAAYQSLDRSGMGDEARRLWVNAHSIFEMACRKM